MAGKDRFAMFQVHFIYSWWTESKRAWYLLFVYAHNYSLPIESLGTGGPRRRPGNESGYRGAPEEAWERVWVRGRPGNESGYGGGPGGGLGTSLGTGLTEYRSNRMQKQEHSIKCSNYATKGKIVHTRLS